MSRDTKRAVAYLRRSTDKQETSLLQQFDWAVAEAARLGLALAVPATGRATIEALPADLTRVGDLYLDNAISGSDLSRPGFNAMLHRLREDEGISHLLVWDRSRFARFERAEHAMMLENDIRELGVSIVLHNAILPPRRISDGSKFEELSGHFEHMAAGKMRMDLAENVLRGQKRVAGQGLWAGGPTPYGFARVLVNLATKEHQVLPPGAHAGGGHGQGVAVIPGADKESLAKLKVVRFIAETYHQGLLGLHRIAKELNRQQVPSPYAGRTRTNRDGARYEVPGKWTVNSVRGILENPVYCGRMAYGRRGYGSLRRFDPESHTGYRHVENEERIPGTNRARAKDERNPERWLLSTPIIPFEPIVPLGVWEANQARLKQMGEVGGQRGRPKCNDPNRFPLWVVCADCGQRMSDHYHDGDLVVYKCSTWLNSGGEKCHANWVGRDQVVVFALDALRRRFRRWVEPDTFRAEVRKALEASQVNRTDLEARLESANAHYAGLKKQAERAMRLVTDAVSDDEAALAEAAYKEKRQLMQQAEGAVRSLEADLVAVGMPIGSEVDRTIGYLKGLDRLLDEMPGDHLRRVFDAMGTRMEVRFVPNTGRGRRRRLPVGGTLTFGHGLATAPGNTESPADAEDSVSRSEEHDFG